MQEIPENIDSLIIRFVEKTASDTECIQLLSWVETDPANQNYFAEQCTLLHDVKASSYSFNSKSAFSKIENQIGSNESVSTNDNVTHVQAKRFNSKLFTGIGATVIVCSIAVFLFFNTKKSNEEPTTTNTKNIVVADTIREIELGNASIIINKGAELETLKSNEDSTILSLKGSAFFNNRKRTPKLEVQTPLFTVNSKNAEFDIYESVNDSHSEITVYDGRVKVLIANKTETLKKNERLFIYKDTIYVNKVNDRNTLAWNTRLLVFVNTPLEHAIQQISEYYNVTIEFKSEKMKYCLLNAKIKDYPFEEVKTMLEIAYEIQFIEENGILYLNGGYCN